MRKTMAVSIEGDAVLRDALRELAKSKGITMGKLITDSVFSAHGDELKPILSFFARGGYKSIQLDTEADHA